MHVLNAAYSTANTPRPVKPVNGGNDLSHFMATFVTDFADSAAFVHRILK
jgi:hypothetical protein